MAKQSPIDFSKQLIKGKIGEVVFEQMFRRVKGYVVIPFGYESIIPELMQYAGSSDRTGVIENLRNAPDFALVSHNPKLVQLVEVKYRFKVNYEEIKISAARICEQWKLAYLFVATPQGFYFDFCEDIAKQTSLTPLSTNIIPAEIQTEYTDLLTEFI
jgi:hypothetical protein